LSRRDLQALGLCFDAVATWLLFLQIAFHLRNLGDASHIWGHTPYLSLVTDNACSDDCWHIPYLVYPVLRLSIIVDITWTYSVDDDEVQITGHCRGNRWAG
jgi:hypothetical protein